LATKEIQCKLMVKTYREGPVGTLLDEYERAAGI